MQDYEPLDIEPSFNSGVAFAPEQVAQQLPSGDVVLLGLPFHFGNTARRCVALLDGTEPIRITIDQHVHNILIAHAFLDSGNGSEPGRVVATYGFCLEQEEIFAPVRERFEIGALAVRGEPPFLAHRRHDAGVGYYVWAWSNPRVSDRVTSLNLYPGAAPVIFAGITLGRVDEWPFPRIGRRPLRITLTQSEDAEIAGERRNWSAVPMPGIEFQSASEDDKLTIEVDRGFATEPTLLPAEATDALLLSDLRGWGEPTNTGSSPVFSEVAATPSAEVVVRRGPDELGRASWAVLEREGIVETSRVRLELLEREKNWVHTTVLDADTGRPIPCRVHFRSADGVPYQPHGHHNVANLARAEVESNAGGDVRLGQMTYAYIDGRCQGWLPRGEVIVDVARGFEYEPLRARVNIGRGQRELTLSIKRWVNMNDDRWFSGDTHVHFLTTQNAHREAEAEDLNVVNLLQFQVGESFFNIADFVGRPTASDDGRTVIYCSQENRQHMLGHLSLLGLREPVVPISTGGAYEAEVGGTLDEVLSHWADACHRQGGTVILPHHPLPNGEQSVLIATGRADAIELDQGFDLPERPWRWGGQSELDYYRCLNAGYPLPLVGGTDKMSSDVPVGLYRTYVKIESEEFNYEAWCRSLRAGRTFVSTGPIMQFSVEGASVGDIIGVASTGGTLEVEASAESLIPIHQLEIVERGTVVASVEEPKGSQRLSLRATLQVDGDTWLAARCASDLHHNDFYGRPVRAHTSPIYVSSGENWSYADRSELEYLLTLVDGGLSFVRQTALHHPHGTVTHHHGEADHLAYLEGPFHEARDAIHRRLHALNIPH